MGDDSTLQTQLTALNFVIDRTIAANKATIRLVEQSKKDIQYSKQQQEKIKAALQSAVEKTVQDMDAETLRFLHDIE